MTRRLDDDLLLWERGELRLPELVERHDDAGVEELVETHVWLSLLASDTSEEPGPDWHVVAARLGEQAPVEESDDRETPAPTAPGGSGSLRRCLGAFLVGAIMAPASALAAQSEQAMTVARNVMREATRLVIPDLPQPLPRDASVSQSALGAGVIVPIPGVATADPAPPAAPAPTPARQPEKPSATQETVAAPVTELEPLPSPEPRPSVDETTAKEPAETPPGEDDAEPSVPEPDEAEPRERKGKNPEDSAKGEPRSGGDVPWADAKGRGDERGVHPGGEGHRPERAAAPEKGAQGADNGAQGAGKGAQGGGKGAQGAGNGAKRMR